MPHQVQITGRAHADVDETLARKMQDSPEAAARWHAALLEKVQTLEDQPERCSQAAEAANLGIDLRELLFGKRRSLYRILFTIEGDLVKVLHIRHAARDWLKREDL